MELRATADLQFHKTCATQLQERQLRKAFESPDFSSPPRYVFLIHRNI